MPVFDFDGVPEAVGFAPLDGQYLACVTSIDQERDGQPLKTDKGDPKWNVGFTVASGERSGGRFWGDWIFPSVTGNARLMGALKRVCKHVAGVAVDGEVDIQPDLFLGKFVLVDCKPNSWKDDEGTKHTNTKVVFAGYSTASDSDVAHGKEIMAGLKAAQDAAESSEAPVPEAQAAAAADDDIPF